MAGHVTLDTEEKEAATVKARSYRYRRACSRLYACSAAAALAFWAVAGVCRGATAQPMPAPNLMSYQGVLYHADGITPYAGLQDIEFRLYANESDLLEDAVWGEKHSEVQVLNGVFSVYLGAGDVIEGTPQGTLADAFRASPLWLGIRIGADDEMAQRQEIRSIPYAMTATSANRATHGVAPGTIVMYAGQIDVIALKESGGKAFEYVGLPEGWLLCDGEAYPRTGEYEALFNAVGTVWGSGDGSTTFNVPNFSGRTPIGAGAGTNANTDTRFGSQAGINARSLGTVTGDKSVALSVSELPPHTHTYDDRYGTPQLHSWGAYGVANSTLRDDERKTDLAGEDAAHNNVQPSAYMHFIIKY